MKSILNTVAYALAGIAIIFVLTGVIWLKLAISDGLAHPPPTAQQIR